MNQNQKPEVITSTEATKVAATQELPIKELTPATTAQAEPKSKKAKKNKAAKAKAAAKAKETESTTGKVKKTKKEVALAAPEVKADKKKKKTAKDKAVEDTANQQKPSIIEEVIISHRDVKYIYPEDVTDTLTRKSWRQKVRAKLRQLERDMFRITDQNSKEYKKAKKAYEEYRAEVLKPAQAV